VALDCAALAGTSERLGALRAAGDGTVFLNDVGALPLDLQPEILHVLETGTLRGPGGPQSVNLRVVAATEHDLGAAVRRGQFRAELLHRLEVVKVRLPPLRERLEDLPLLVEQLAQGRLAPGETAAGEGLTRLTAHFWPGNVRELRDVLERAFALCGPREGLRFADLVLVPGRDEPHPSAPASSEALPFKRAKEQLLKGFEQTYLRALLAKHNGNLSRAAAAAGISRKHIYALLRRSGRPSP
jgi:DNA-binding NtrC family response regulator